MDQRAMQDGPAGAAAARAAQDTGIRNPSRRARGPHLVYGIMNTTARQVMTLRPEELHILMILLLRGVQGAFREPGRKIKAKQGH